MTVEQVKNIWENCPKAVSKLIEWYKKTMSASPTGNPQIDGPLEEIIKNAEKALMISLSFPTAPRALYEFFDENLLYVSVYYNSGRLWEYTVDSHTVGDLGDEFVSRIATENEAFYSAFKHLEDKLND